MKGGINSNYREKCVEYTLEVSTVNCTAHVSRLAYVISHWDIISAQQKIAWLKKLYCTCKNKTISVSIIIKIECFFSVSHTIALRTPTALMHHLSEPQKIQDLGLA